jgi:putative thioredoxin
MIHDVGEDQFQAAVVERSHQVPVVVDFWAEWCGPCRQLSPALEAEAGKRGDDVDLAKVDVDANQALSQSFGVQGIPAVKAFKDGKIVSEFTGAIPPAQVAAFFDALVPSEADLLASSADEGDLRRALELDPRNVKAATGLARILLARGDSAAAAELLDPFEGDFVAAGLGARAALEVEEAVDPALAAAFAAWDAGEHAEALEALQGSVSAAAEQERRDQLRRVMVAIFTELGPESDLARDHRRRLALALT